MTDPPVEVYRRGDSWVTRHLSDVWLCCALCGRTVSPGKPYYEAQGKLFSAQLCAGHGVDEVFDFVDYGN